MTSYTEKENVICIHTHDYISTCIHMWSKCTGEGVKKRAASCLYEAERTCGGEFNERDLNLLLYICLCHRKKL